MIWTMLNDIQLGKENETLAPRGWILPLLAVALAGYVLWMGQGLAWNQQQGHYWFYLAPWWTNTSVKFIAISVALSVIFFFGNLRLSRWMPASCCVTCRPAVLR